MSTPVGIIKKFVDTLTKTSAQGEAAADEAFKSVGAVSYGIFRQKFNAAKSGLGTQDFLEQKCGIRVNNTDTGAITGSDAGGSTTKTAESIVPETAKAKELTAAQYKSFTKNGLTVNITYNEKGDVDAGEKFNYSGETYLEKQKLVVRALYNWWIPESLDLINKSLGINFTDGRASINEINIVFDDGFNNNPYATSINNISYDMGRASSVTLCINPRILYNMTADDKNGTLEGNKAIYSNFYGRINFSGSAYGKLNIPHTDYSDHTTYFSNYLDRIILQTLTEVAIKSNVSYAYNLPSEIRAGLCEIVGGFDSGGYLFDIAEFQDDSRYSGNPQALGYGFLRYLAKNYSDGLPDEDELPAGLSYNKNKTVLTASTAFKGDTIDLADFESTVKTVNASKLKNDITIIGNAKNNSIVSGSGNDLIDGGKGNDTLNGGKGNDTLTGGDGEDIFVYTAGKDVISDYSAEDKIKFSAAISKSTISGSNVVFTVGSGTLTVKNGKGKKITIVDENGEETTKTYSAESTTLTVTNSTESPLTIGSKIKVVNATKRTKAIEIIGNTLANSISGGTKNDIIHGGAGNDTLLGNAGNDKLLGDAGADVLDGGKGNDTLTGGDGKDIFVYTAGKDVISDYAAGDKIKFSAAISKSTVKGSNVVFTVGSGTLTVKNGKGKKITIVDENGEETTKTYSAAESTTLTVTNSTESPLTIGSKIKVVNATKRTTAIEIIGNTLANSISGGTKNDTIHGGAGNDTLLGNAGNDKLLGDAGADVLDGGKGNDTLTGGAGNDIFVYTAGKDVISDYAAGDKIKFSAAISKSTISGSNVVFTVGSGTLTVKNGTGKKITIVDENGEETTKTYSATPANTTTLAITNATESPLTIGSKVKVVNAAKRTTAIEITGNTLANSISGGKANDTISGGAGNDSLLGNAGDDYLNGDDGNDYINGGAGADLISGDAGKDSLFGGANDDTLLGQDDNDYLDGGAGDDYLEGHAGNDYLLGGAGADWIFGGYDKDTLWGGAGDDYLDGGGDADIFIYKPGEGTDTILDYYESDGDMLKILNKDGSEGGTFSDSGFVDNKLTLTISGGGKVVFDGGYFENININGETYTVSDEKLVKQ